MMAETRLAFLGIEGVIEQLLGADHPLRRAALAVALCTENRRLHEGVMEFWREADRLEDPELVELYQAAADLKAALTAGLAELGRGLRRRGLMAADDPARERAISRMLPVAGEA